MRTPSPLVAVVAAAVLAVLPGCAGTSTKMISEARPPVAVETVRFHYERPAGAVDIAWLESTSALGFGTQGQRDAVLDRIAREAAALGANGVLLLGGGTQDSGVGLGVGVGGGHYDHNSGAGVSVGGGIPTTQERVHGVAIWVPPGAQARAGLEAGLKAAEESMPADPVDDAAADPPPSDD